MSDISGNAEVFQAVGNMDVNRELFTISVSVGRMYLTEHL
jgi:hypothetical protein